MNNETAVQIAEGGNRTGRGATSNVELSLIDDIDRYASQIEATIKMIIEDNNFNKFNADTVANALWVATDRARDIIKTTEKIQGVEDESAR